MGGAYDIDDILQTKGFHGRANRIFLPEAKCARLALK
jgi:hypothetical protein